MYNRQKRYTRGLPFPRQARYPAPAPHVGVHLKRSHHTHPFHYAKLNMAFTLPVQNGCISISKTQFKSMFAIVNWELGFKSGPFKSETLPDLKFEIEPDSAKLLQNTGENQHPKVKSDLVFVKNEEAVTTSLAVASGTNSSHEAVIKLVRKYSDDLSEFGPLGFEIHVVNRPQGGGSPSQYALLNEPQATLLLTYMRNNDVVRDFKKRLVKAFFSMKEFLSNHHTPNPVLDIEACKMIEERDEAIRTKAQISDAKTATALARASKFKRENGKLQKRILELEAELKTEKEKQQEVKHALEQIIEGQGNTDG